MVVVDTGVLYALADRRDAHHAACVRWLVTARGPLVVPPLVVAETCYLIGRHLGAAAEAAFLDALGPGEPFVLGDLVAADVARMAELVRRYADLPLGGTDAAVVAVAERLGVVEVATVDRRRSPWSGPRTLPRSPWCPSWPGDGRSCLGPVGQGVARCVAKTPRHGCGGMRQRGRSCVWRRRRTRAFLDM